MFWKDTAVASDVEADDRLRGARILVIDDTPVNVEVLTETLARDGYVAVDSTTSPVEGLAMTAAGAYDLVLLDMRMPEMDGLEFLNRLRARCSAEQLPVLMVTAQSDGETKHRALAAGVHDFITKPFVLWELLLRVRHTLELHMQHRAILRLNSELEERVIDRTRELEATRKEVIRRLASAGEFRDNETGQHVVRMSHFAHHLALAAGLSDGEAAMIRDAAPLHDIGKIGIPDAILLKAGPLDPPEWEIMKRHAAIGGEILADSGFALLDLARTIAVSHHEKWNGDGYPLGLRGEEIPIAGRLTAIADVFDALTSTRSYKSAWPIEQARLLIERGSGHHFDPKLADLFERELPAILELRDRFRDSDDGQDGASPRLFRVI